MDLIAALIAQLDQSPNVAAELKVFTHARTATRRALTRHAPHAVRRCGRSGAADGRRRRARAAWCGCNSRSTSGPTASSPPARREDLAVVEAILLRLDEGDIRERNNVVYRLNNASAQDVSEHAQQLAANAAAGRSSKPKLTISPFEQIEREVIIVPELASNSLVVSATPRYFEDVRSIIEELDERPPMVLIQVLIAEVRLNDTDEFGVELGLQDSLLFDRSLRRTPSRRRPTRQDTSTGQRYRHQHDADKSSTRRSRPASTSTTDSRWATTAAPARLATAAQRRRARAVELLGGPREHRPWLRRLRVLRLEQQRERAAAGAAGKAAAGSAQPAADHGPRRPAGLIVQVGQNVPPITRRRSDHLRPDQLRFCTEPVGLDPAGGAADQPRRPGRDADHRREVGSRSAKRRAFPISVSATGEIVARAADRHHAGASRPSAR